MYFPKLFTGRDATNKAPAGTASDAFETDALDSGTVSYTHLTLPTNDRV